MIRVWHERDTRIVEHKNTKLLQSCCSHFCTHLINFHRNYVGCNCVTAGPAMKYKLDKQINEVAEGVHNKGRTSKSGFVGVVIRPLSYLCGHVPLINNDKYECVYTAKDKTAVRQIPTRQTRRPRVEPIMQRDVCVCVFLSFLPAFSVTLLFYKLHFSCSTFRWTL